MTRRDKSRDPVTRDILQYQFTSWPDHGTPNNITPVLSFIKKSSAACQVVFYYNFLATKYPLVLLFFGHIAKKASSA